MSTAVTDTGQHITAQIVGAEGVLPGHAGQLLLDVQLGDVLLVVPDHGSEDDEEDQNGHHTQADHGALVLLELVPELTETAALDVRFLFLLFQ